MSRDWTTVIEAVWTWQEMRNVNKLCAAAAAWSFSQPAVLTDKCSVRLLTRSFPPFPCTPIPRALTHAESSARPTRGLTSDRQTKTPQSVLKAGGRQRWDPRSPPARKRARTVDFLPAYKIIRRAENNFIYFQYISKRILSSDVRGLGHLCPGFVTNHDMGCAIRADRLPLCHIL